MCQEFTRTRFATKSFGVSPSPDKGVPIGIGACKAVRLRINAFSRNTNNPVGTPLMSPAYYGDSQSQECELVGGVTFVAGDAVFYTSEWTPLIYCKNLEEVFIRASAGVGNAHLQIMILD